jgi:hypothetical protein
MKSATVKTRRGIIFIEEKKVEKIPENNLKKPTKQTKHLIYLFAFCVFTQILLVNASSFIFSSSSYFTTHQSTTKEKRGKKKKYIRKEIEERVVHFK